MITPMPTNRTLDSIDRRIIDVLQVDGRISVNDLAERIGLSASPTLRRLRRLEQTKVILGYRADIDPHAVGRGLTVWVTLRLALMDPDRLATFEQALVGLDSVTSVHHVTGDVDYLVRVDIADLDAYDEVIRKQIPSLPGEAHVTSYVVTSTIADHHGLVGNEPTAAP